MVYNTLPVAAQGAADLEGLRPHAAGPEIVEKVCEVYSQNRKKS